MSDIPVDLDSRRSPQERQAAEIRRDVRSRTDAATGSGPGSAPAPRHETEAEANARAQRVSALRATTTTTHAPIRPYDPERDNPDTRRRTRSESAFRGLYCPLEEETSGY